MNGGGRLAGFALAVALAASPARIAAQDTVAAGPVRVRGVAFDGVRGEPLRDAVVTLVGFARTTTTDSRGRFHFDSVQPGVYTFAAQHARLDSIGFNSISTHVAVSAGTDEVRIAVPSFASLWRVECGADRAPKDSGFVYGTVLDAEGHQPIAGSSVRVRWSELVLDARRRVTERRRTLETRTDSAGNYAVCGVALDEWLVVSASSDAAESGEIDLPPTDLRVQRRDLRIGTRADSASAPARTEGGTIVGMVTDATGAPFPAARVATPDVTQVRSGDDGRFVLRNVPTGTRQVHAWAIGVVPVTLVVDVVPNDSAVAMLQLLHATSLDGMRIVAARAGHVLAMEFAERRRHAAGYFADSAEVMRYPTVADALARAPGVSVTRPGGRLNVSMPGPRGAACTPELRIDGAEAEFGHLADLDTPEVAGVEIYPRPMLIPIEFVRAGHVPTCGMILAWTKYGFRNR